jgi:hypothetical protein
MIVTWRLYRLVPIKSASLVLIYEHQFYKMGNRLIVVESSPRHGSRDPISATARGARV